MTIVQRINLKTKDESIIFYSDSKGFLSFVKVKNNNKSLEKIIEKIEKTPFFRNLVFLIFFHFLFIGIMRVRNYSFTEAYLSFGYDKSLNVKMNFLFPAKLREKFALKTGKISLLIHAYWCWVPMKGIYQHYVRTSEINTPVFIKLSQDGYNFWYNLKSNSKHKYNKRHYLYNSRSYRLSKENNELFIRKSVTGQYVIVLTSIMKMSIKLKEWLAYLFSVFSSNKEKYDVYFEKFCAGASESGFEMFKYAYNKGDSCVYILEKEHPEFDKLKKEYGKSLLPKNSFFAFYYIFLARSFQSSDLVSHIQRRLYDNDFLIKKKILNTNKKVMLQHGVCMCTNLFERGYFNRKVPIAPDFLLVNSNYEKNLFLKNTGYNDKELMITGLPNLDLYVKEKDRPKEEITFMLTWRPWDLTGSIEHGTYLHRYLSFIELISKETFYQDKTINVVLHPKSKIILQEQFPDIYTKYESFFYEGDIKDALLRSKILISDYSSVVYYAFAGGSNVIFYWEDKEKAEEQYGAPNILQRDIAFGDIAMAFKDLHAIIVKNYNNPQSSFYIKKYDKLIECTDGHNTENTYNYIQTNIFKHKREHLSKKENVAIN
ncbi:CDP-glycerol glycerophosphotransferase family protein [Heyndrickxia sporothermodurans]|uniref:CDP-glycerol glycerophosphotransferase family protein n=1 Tax=Heyndrickxia sporothermodurans TaxID=46224 RepID=UPI003D211D83